MQLWEDISQVADGLQYPWIVRGDFNVVLNGEEKIGGRPVTGNERKIKKVKAALSLWSKKTFGDIQTTHHKRGYNKNQGKTLQGISIC
ncbi:hypothetical protein KY290_025256 [Solanum tuberosum]|uniref:Uncharacterized protein n=1 Tax=Solanum tuberosum TaxID=4113 RepID=A0ABQ7UV49_SOLTU|nr:hypothetical protein KY284_024064 [Solanum tuberosum]KAH0754986.1 hypothetical protein KY290_025256 [Solanum tuberosum]